MEFKQSLAQRIIIAFALMSALVAGAFAMGIVATVHLVEEKLISAGLGGDFDGRLFVHVIEPGPVLERHCVLNQMRVLH